ncbi:ribonuclease HII [Ereboglobus sp. PH5-10]|uniref:ribonuclease HII n=1 Tax=Ereboglobus sp. PH5-10 TaxID=2940629 RepID=UPI002407603B|nr:ribonuclease HII [Ereboglobus sp. PH5-10]MDF9826755.1 ribonuclease HII [Ereboglobus sp. PH5-10]
MKRRQLRGYDLKQINGYESLIGVDEAGRGALAGPVVAAAVLVTREFLASNWAMRNAGRINDSKQLTAAGREEAWNDLDKLARGGLIHAHHGVASVDEIEQMDILGATKLAMRRALEGIYPPAAFRRSKPGEPELFADMETRSPFFGQKLSCRILVDGLPLKSFPYPHTGVVGGDARSLCIAMASIIAKVTRDRLMTELDGEHPGYGFEQHKGYGTEMHRAAVLEKGSSPQHRAKFLRKLLDHREDPGQLSFFENGGQNI